MKKILITLLFLSSLVILTSCKNKKNITNNLKTNVTTEEIEEKEYDYIELSEEEIRNKVLGCWIGHAIGMGSGYEYVVSTDNVVGIDGSVVDGYLVEDKTAIIALADKYWEPDGEICSGSIGINHCQIHPISDPRVLKGVVYSDDDMHVDILNQFIFRDYGPVVGANDITSAWKYYDVNDVGGGSPAKTLMQYSNYVAPYTGQSTYGNTSYCISESWIENETLGILFPYMYDLSLGYADLFTQVQGDAHATYLGKLCALMYSLAYQYDDTKIIMEKAFSVMDHDNEVYEMYEFVKKCYNQKVSWRQVCIECVKRSSNVAKLTFNDMAGFSYDANAAMIFIGLFYGENDFEESIKITSLCGLDGDCTAATVGGLLGTMLGFSGIEEKYQDFLNGDSVYYNYTGSNSAACGVYWGAFAYCNKNFPNKMTFNQIVDLTMDNIKMIVEAYHGSYENGKFKIAIQTLKEVENVSTPNYGFENGTTDNWYFEGTGETTFTASKAAAHLGNYGGLIVLGEATNEAKAYQTVNLVIGNTYKVSLWINGGTDREFRLFAKDGNNYFFKTYVNPVSFSKYFMKATFTFVATSETMNVGIEYIKSFEECYSTTFGIDNFAIEDVTCYKTSRGKTELEAENITLVGTAKRITGSEYSNNKAVYLESDDAISTTINGNGQQQKIMIYYSNPNEMMGAVNINIDGTLICSIPLVSTGINNSYNVSNYQSVDLYLGKGSHTLTIEYTSFDTLIIDKIVVVNANKLLEW